MARQYFGTDGIRGEVGIPPITPDFVMRLGYAAGKVLAQAEAAATQAIATAAAGAPPLQGPAQRMFDQACAACHHDGNGPRLLGVNVPLALNSNLHSERPDNLRCRAVQR